MATLFKGSFMHSSVLLADHRTNSVSVGLLTIERNERGR